MLTFVIIFLSLTVWVGIAIVGGWEAMWAHYDKGFGSLNAGFITGYFPPQRGKLH